MVEKTFYRNLLKILILTLVFAGFSGSVLQAQQTEPMAAAKAAPGTDVVAAERSLLGEEVRLVSPEASAALSAHTGQSAPQPAVASTAGTDLIGRDVNAIDNLSEDASHDVANDLEHNLVKENLEEYLPGGILDVLKKEVFGISVLRLTYSFLILLFILIVRNILTRIIFVYLAKALSKTRFRLDEKLFDALQKPVSAFLLFFGIYVALMILPFSEPTVNLIGNLYRGLIVILIVWALMRVVDVILDVFITQNQTRFLSIHGFVPLIRKTLKIFIGVVGFVMVIDNLGFNIGGILATLGIGGAALAFASKDTIANGFGTLMIMLDRPFKVGDWIIVGDKVDGDVEEIGLRSTKVRTWPKTLLSIPNGVLANEYINNWSLMPKRRVKQIVNISYGATANDMETMVKDIRQLLREDDGVDQEFMLVNFTDLDNYSLDILVYYFTKSIKWLEHMDVRERVNLKIMRAVEARGLTIAYPTQTLQFDGQVASKMVNLPWESRWDVESKENPDGTYTVKRASQSGPRGGGSATDPDSVNKQPKLPGDFGPKHPF